MGTSVKMIEDHYGHVAPAKNAELILRGVPEWDIVAADPGETAARVNADAAGEKPKPTRKAQPVAKAKPRTKK